MTPQEKKQVLLAYLRLKTEDEDWSGAKIALNDLQEVEVALRYSKVATPSVTTQPELTSRKIEPSVKEAEPYKPAPPVDVEIKHHVNEVANLLKLSDEDLVDKLFPDYSQDDNA